jgi:Domain of unknown function (DUF4157)
MEKSPPAVKQGAPEGAARNAAPDFEPARGARSGFDKLLELQRQAGNRTVRALLERERGPRFTVGAADSAHERQADRIAKGALEQVRGGARTQIQRVSAGAPAAHTVGGGVAASIAGARGVGQALPEPVRANMEQTLGADFSGVRVNADARADRLSRTLGARAFTVGHDVFFRSGQYQPESRAGRELLAHELTHVAQQGAGSTLIQRAMGLEAEVPRPVRPAGGGDLVGDTDLLDSTYFKLVSDHRSDDDGKGYPNVEFVMKHFDQLTGDEPTALAALDTRMNAIKAYRTLLYANDTKRKLPAGSGALTGAGSTTYLDWTGINLTDDKKLFVHYTIGFPPEKLFSAINAIGKETREEGGPVTGRSQRPQTHAAGALTVANAVLAKHGTGLNVMAKADLKGAIALYYTQVAAFVDMMHNSFHDASKNKPFGGGQIKNKTALLSRVPLRTIYGSLKKGARDALKANADDIIEMFIAELDKTGADWNDDWVRGKKDNSAQTTLKDYALSGLGEKPSVDQETVFGGMNETPLDASVMGRGIPLEARSFGKGRVTWDEFVADAKRLLKWSRKLINPAPPPPVVPVTAPVATVSGGKRKRITVSSGDLSKQFDLVTALAINTAAKKKKFGGDYVAVDTNTYQLVSYDGSAGTFEFDVK